MSFHSSLSDYIAIFKNVVPEALCDDIINEYEKSNDWGPAALGINHTVNTDVRNVDSISMGNSLVLNKNFALRKSLDQGMFRCAGVAIQQYNQMFPRAQMVRDTGYILLRYQEGQFHTNHVDSSNHNPRAISCSFALNDNYEGGEFGFWEREKIYRLEKGDCIVFPSNFMYPHEIIPITNGIRYSIITWFL